MKERPIIFTDDQVRAILDGRKTQTRRIVKPQPSKDHQYLGHVIESTNRKDEGKCRWGIGEIPYSTDAIRVRPPYGVPGDRLWVREAHAKDGWQIWFRSDCDKGPASEVCQYQDGSDFEGTWAPSIHMPRWASRITLEITEVRVERVQEISGADAKAEGMCSRLAESSSLLGPAGSYKDNFRTAWNSINGHGSWDENPWVWVVEFKRQEVQS
ncbi:hypothetical protein [Guyparkeria halopsychrophila]|uniref:hypothetical protein n=1 Tax=Guyparkeria halopsychrophila TaxID=3139421 RepID=UPI0037C5A82E